MAALPRIVPTVDHRRLSSSLRMLRTAGYRTDLQSVLNELCARYGLSHMIFLVVSSGGGSGLYPYYCTTYPKRWTEICVDKRYFDIDPVIDVMRCGFLPTPASRLFRDARSYAVGPHGLTIPIRGLKGERSLFFCDLEPT